MSSVLSVLIERSSVVDAFQSQMLRGCSYNVQATKDSLEKLATFSLCACINLALNYYSFSGMTGVSYGDLPSFL